MILCALARLRRSGFTSSLPWLIACFIATSASHMIPPRSAGEHQVMNGEAADVQPAVT